MGGSMSFIDLPILVLAAFGAAGTALLGYLLQAWRLKRRQRIVDRVLCEIADPEKTPTEVFLLQMENFGILDPEGLTLEGKYGPGIASDVSLARLLARLVSERVRQTDHLAASIVTHFIRDSRGIFPVKEARLLVFHDQILACFRLDDREQLLDRCNLDYVVRNRLARERQIERERLEKIRWLAEDKAERRRLAIAAKTLDGRRPTVRPRPVEILTSKIKALPVKTFFF
jgi:hypothetical protein